jgi:hypothetical protein
MRVQSLKTGSSTPKGFFVFESYGGTMSSQDHYIAVLCTLETSYNNAAKGKGEIDPGVLSRFAEIATELTHTSRLKGLEPPKEIQSVYALAHKHHSQWPKSDAFIRLQKLGENLKLIAEEVA